jgi:hypothetical protein
MIQSYTRMPLVQYLRSDSWVLSVFLLGTIDILLSELIDASIRAFAMREVNLTDIKIVVK